jgi:2-haloacid dehalogenase
MDGAMPRFRPKFITFDCYGTLTRFRMGELAEEIFADRVAPARMADFVRDFSAYRLDEVLGAWKPYVDVVTNAVHRTCRKHRIECSDAEARRFYDAVPSWGPHDDVPPALSLVARHYKLVGLSNAANAQIMTNVGMYGAPFHAVITAEQAQSYKPRMRGFEFMMEQLGARPEDLLHVSSSFRYDLFTAHDLGIADKIWVNRGHEPAASGFYGYHEIKDLSGLPALLGL